MTSSPSVTWLGTVSMITQVMVDRCQKVKMEARRELIKKIAILNGCYHQSVVVCLSRYVSSLLYGHEQIDFIDSECLIVSITILEIL